jgi:CTP:phosphocholine cytidylyltransferase-like protein
MDSRLLYHTSMTQTQTQKQIPNTIQYYTSLQSTDIALNNLKKINNKLDDTNIITLAYLANNPYLNDEEREKYSNKLKEMAMNEYHIISTYVNDFIYRNKDCSSNITECDN